MGYMQTFKVDYAVADRANTLTQGFTSAPGMGWLSTTVQAMDANQARQIVENMHGGRQYCRTHGATLLRS